MFGSEAFSIVRIAQEGGVALYPRKNKPDQYFANCPLCGDQRKRLNVHGSRDVFNCYNCHESGGTVRFYALLHNVSEASAKETLRPKLEGLSDRVQRKIQRHPAMNLSVTDIRELGFAGSINWYQLRKDDPNRAKQIAAWVWREKQAQQETITRLMKALEE